MAAENARRVDVVQVEGDIGTDVHQACAHARCAALGSRVQYGMRLDGPAGADAMAGT